MSQCRIRWGSCFYFEKLRCAGKAGEKHRLCEEHFTYRMHVPTNHWTTSRTIDNESILQAINVDRLADPRDGLYSDREGLSSAVLKPTQGASAQEAAG